MLGLVGVDLSDDLEAQYQQEKEPARPTLGRMTEEHIIALAKHRLGLDDSQISGIAEGDGWIRLYWDEGVVYVDDNQVSFSANAGYPSLHLLRLIASWGYDVMMEDER